ncbi:TPA: hypothetical protein ACRGPQ_004620, partial [Klebsiella pneumoniae]
KAAHYLASRIVFTRIINSPPLTAWRTAHAPYNLFPAAITAHTMIAFDIISGEYLTGSDSLEYIDRQRSALSEKRITITRAWHYCRRAGFRQPTIYQSGLY